MSRALALAVALLTLTASAHARDLLQNDSFEPGDAVAFYTRFNVEESFASLYAVPDDHPVYRLCRVFLFVGPAGFNIYVPRIGVGAADGTELALIWQPDEDAYQVFGSANQLTAIDLSAFDITTDARLLRVRMQVYGGSSPSIAVDSDGITPGRNVASLLLRNGQRHRGFTEELDPAGTPPQPAGDWIMRTEIVRPGEACPAPGDPPIEPDPGGPGVDDMGVGDDLGVDDMGLADLGAEDMALDDSVEPDAMPDAMPDVMPDVMPDAIADALVDATGDATPDAGSPLDRGPRPDRAVGDNPLELTRISPTQGPADRNTEVIINGRGFLDGGGVVRAEVGRARLLEVEALSGSTLGAVVPAGVEPGTHDLRLTRADGQVAVLPSAFTIGGAVGPLPPLRLDRITPDSVIGGRPAELTIEGGGFTDGTLFTVGGAPLEGVVLTEDTARGTLVVRLAAGIYDVAARRGDEVVRLERALAVRGVPQDDGCRAAPGPRAPLGPAGWLLALALVARRRRR